MGIIGAPRTEDNDFPEKTLRLPTQRPIECLSQRAAAAAERLKMDKQMDDVPVDTTGGQYDLFFAVALIGTAALTLLAVLSVVGGAW